MSRWTDAYEKHAFQSVWESIKGELKTLVVDDETVITSVEEIGRLRKVVSFVDGLLRSIDPELLPQQVLDSFHQQSVLCLAEIKAYGTSRDIANIKSANNHADNLLSYVRPHMVATGRVAKSLRQAAQAYSDSFTEYAEAFVKHAKSSLNVIDNAKEGAVAEHKVIDEIKDKVNEIKSELLGDGGTSGTYNVVVKLISDVERHHGEIEGFHKQLIIGSEEKDPLRDEVEAAVAEVGKQKESVSTSIRALQQAIKNISDFEAKIFGVAKEDGERVGGLSSDLDDRVKKLGEFERTQKIRYEALNERVENLLPGATSAGLASSYREMKESFNGPIRSASNFFYISIGALVLFSAISLIEAVSLTEISFRQINNWREVLQSLAFKAPLYLPIVWLAYYSSKRRSECQRLQQEYAHKEALAASYDSYKKQIEDLGVEYNAMVISLMENAINAISRNASETLDGRHGDKMPIQEVADRLAERIATKMQSKGE